MISSIVQPLRTMRSYMSLPPAAKVEYKLDRAGLPASDPGVDTAIDECAGWICRAQDNSKYKDGGVARHYSLLRGWSASYPETTGYIVPTMLKLAEVRKNGDYRSRAARMLDWLVSIQLRGGGFQGGLIDSEPVVPVTFNTGQILLGLAAGTREFGDRYRPAMRGAADCLVETLDPDGCWRKMPTPFAAPGEKAYETHVAWGLLEAAQLDPDRGYAEAALANVRWAMSKQKENGWFESCCLNHPSAPLTHTLGYVLRGILEAYLFFKDETLLESSVRTADGLLKALNIESGFLPGRIDSQWRGAVPWVCLTGSVQVAYSWLRLYEITDNQQYRDAAYAANRYVRRTLKIDGPAQTRGGVKGSFPVYAGYDGRHFGGYGAFEYLNWAAKFFIDSNLLEKEVRGNSDAR